MDSIAAKRDEEKRKAGGIEMRCRTEILKQKISKTQKEMKEGGKRAEMEPDRPCRPDRSDQEKKKKVTMQVAGQSKN
jgi:hypothetical protein